jgi:hypothetical protein
MYFTVSVKTSFVDDKGKTKKVTERYLVDAMSVTEAEARVVKALEDSINEFEIVSASTSRILEVISPDTTPEVYASK